MWPKTAKSRHWSETFDEQSLNCIYKHQLLNHSDIVNIFIILQGFNTLIWEFIHKWIISWRIALWNPQYNKVNRRQLPFQSLFVHFSLVLACMNSVNSKFSLKGQHRDIQLCPHMWLARKGCFIENRRDTWSWHIVVVRLAHSNNNMSRVFSCKFQIYFVLQSFEERSVSESWNAY